MSTFLPIGLARDQVARQFVCDEPGEVAAPAPQPVASAPRRNPFAALLRKANLSLHHATWSPTR